MERNKVDAYMATNQKYYPEDKLLFIRDSLDMMDDDRFIVVLSVPKKDPLVVLILSIFLGYLGIDRFFLGNMGLRVIKLITCGRCGIWTIVDWFLIMGVARNVNMQKLQTIL